MTPTLIVPGIGSSGPAHWQTLWEASDTAFRRVEMPSWERPELEGWLASLQAAVDAASGEPIIVAHSLGCLAVAHYASRGGRARAALLVAPPDPDSAIFPTEARSFAPVPLVRLPFRTRLVASRNDPYSTLGFARSCARSWGSDFVDVGPVGHINAGSGLGAWPEGRALLDDLLE
ncbi:MAG: serine hydrolase family protein [Myxococcales bacterium]|nr:MAG: serine hydrolase family protein [Myxococcales bacterium]